jgi:hypothetical protein
MATNAIAGFRGHIRVSADGTTYVALGEITDATFQDIDDEIPADHHDDPAYHNSVAGRSKWTLRGTMNYVYNDAGQLIVRTAKSGKAPVYVKIMPYELVGREKFTGTALVLEFGVGMPDNGIASTNINLSGVGAIVAGTIVSGDLT